MTKPTKNSIKHIAIDARVINSSTGRYIERLLTYLEQLDSPHKYTVLVRAKDRDYWQPSKPNFRVKVADYHQYTVAEQTRFWVYLRKLNADLVHFCMPQQPILYRGRNVTTVHDLNLLRITENEGMSRPVLTVKKFIFKQVLRSVTKRSNVIITPTKYTKQDLLKFKRVPSDKVVVTYESADKLSDNPKEVRAYKDTQYLLVVGRAETYKNQRGAIEAHQLLLAEHPNLRLVIVGKRDQTSRKLQGEMNTKGYQNIDFYGFASDEELAWLYENCAAYVFPTFMEGFGLPPLEAMRHGAPVASSNATCLPEVLGTAASYFDPSDTQQMADAIAKILDNPTHRTQLIKAGAKQASKYSWARMAEQTHDAYNRALEQHY